MAKDDKKLKRVEKLNPKNAEFQKPAIAGFCLSIYFKLKQFAIQTVGNQTNSKCIIPAISIT